jgi:hypothetical protein
MSLAPAPPPQPRQHKHHDSGHPGMQLETVAGQVEPVQPGRGAGLARAGQGEGDQRVAGRGAGFAMAAGCDQDKLAALPEIARRGGDAGEGQAASLQLGAVSASKARR